MPTATATPPRTTSTPPTRRTWSGTSLPNQVLVLTGRSLRALRDPRMLVMSLLTPMIMLLLFSQVFRSIAHTPGFPTGVNYIDYLLPAILVTTATQAALTSGVGLANDLRNGVLSRFRALPIRMVSVLFARSFYDLTRSAVQLVLLLMAAALLFGYAPGGGILGSAAALALAIAVGWGLGWAFLALGAWLRTVEVMQTVGFVAIFPLMFASSAYVPIASLPGWLQAVAKVNPLTYAIDAARGLALGTPTLGPIAGALLTSAVITVIGSSLAARGIRRP
ncbi:transport permease protein [Longimycelium tulufanense]|uniref:Transport permease protein n=1 Tax=Longimycelium tulufanense TaxID=907463 RepID=A0A8J3CFX3_9PSEU|nr:ABC transporter permease [Longimycelium tulufanense]GGM73107.1 transport permease protein [Longimycelium tulufanense]